MSWDKTLKALITLADDSVMIVEVGKTIEHNGRRKRVIKIQT